MQWTPPPQRDRYVPIRERDGSVASAVLAFAERQELAEAVEEVAGFKNLEIMIQKRARD